MPAVRPAGPLALFDRVHAVRSDTVRRFFICPCGHTTNEPGCLGWLCFARRVARSPLDAVPSAVPASRTRPAQTQDIASLQEEGAHAVFRRPRIGFVSHGGRSMDWLCLARRAIQPRPAGSRRRCLRPGLGRPRRRIRRPCEKRLFLRVAGHDRSLRIDHLRSDVYSPLLSCSDIVQAA